jgi:hypothetical protein
MNLQLVYCIHCRVGRVFEAREMAYAQKAGLEDSIHLTHRDYGRLCTQVQLEIIPRRSPSPHAGRAIGGDAITG